MAKKTRAGGNKSQRIRDFLKKHPAAQNKDVAEALSKYGVNAQDVANLKTRMKTSGVTKKKTAVKKKKKAAPQKVDLASVEAAAGFIASVGGVDKAKGALSAAEKIAKQLK